MNTTDLSFRSLPLLTLCLALSSGCGDGSMEDSDAASGGSEAGGGAMSGGSESGGASSGGADSGGGFGEGGASGGGGDQIEAPGYARIAATSMGTCVLDESDHVVCWGSTPDVPWDYPDVDGVSIRGSGMGIGVLGSDGVGRYFYEGSRDWWPEGLHVFAEGRQLQLMAVGSLDWVGITPAGEILSETARADEELIHKAPEAITDLAGVLIYCGIRARDAGISCWHTRTETDNPCVLGYARGQLDPPPGRFLSIVAGLTHLCGLREDGEVLCWGVEEDPVGCPESSRVYYGQTHVPPGKYRYLAAGRAHTCAIRLDGSVACWGAGTTVGECMDGLPPYECGMSLPPPDSDFVQLAAGAEHTCGLKESGKVLCWGTDYYGATLPPPELRP